MSMVAPVPMYSKMSWSPGWYSMAAQSAVTS
jgi:hypothetical protein